MGAETLHAEHHRDTEIVRAIEAAKTSIADIRSALEGHEAQLLKERAAPNPDHSRLQHLTRVIDSLRSDLVHALAFLEEFDPVLFRTLKDNS